MDSFERVCRNLERWCPPLASIDFKSFEGATALIYQVSDKKREILEVIQFLLEHGADPNVEPIIGLTPLMLATQNGKNKTAKLLLEHGADPNVKTIEGNTSLIIATQKDQYETAKLLLEHGANIDDHENLSGNVPLHFAVSFRHMRILKLLIENGASIDFKALDGATALTYAVSYKPKEMAEFLTKMTG